MDTLEGILTTLADLDKRLRRMETQEHTHPTKSARVYNNANITIATATDTQLTFNSERWDTSAIHSTSSNTGRLTAPVAGKYLIGAHIAWPDNTTGHRTLSILLNGATVIGSTRVTATAGGVYSIQSIATLYNLSATDYVEVMVRQTSGGDLDIVYAAQYSPEFWMQRIT